MNVQVLSKQQIGVIACAILSIVLAAAGCSQGTSAGNPAPAGVEVVEVQQKDVPIYGEWIGTLDGLVNADIKAQVSGYLLKQNYTEGPFKRRSINLRGSSHKPTAV
jgi:membrane fusion protein (multidrug efflux system)